MWLLMRFPAAPGSPLLSLAGSGAFAVFLWARTGTPLANLDAQRDGWREKANAFALVHQAQDIWHELHRPHLRRSYPHTRLRVREPLARRVVSIAGH